MKQKITLIIIILFIGIASFFLGWFANRGITEDMAINIADSLILYINNGSTRYFDFTDVKADFVMYNQRPCYRVYRYYTLDVNDGNITIIIDKVTGEILECHQDG